MMKRIFKSGVSIVLTVCILSLLLGGCSSVKKNIVGKWYNQKDKCLDIRSDGSWKLEGSYGTGTWKLLDDKTTVEFTDFYGDTQESEIYEDDYGEYIDFGYYGDFYRDSYPSERDDDSSKGEKESKGDKSSNSGKTVRINPFDGIKFEISGISPYCKITVNNQNCSEEVQKYVEYSFDKEYYANNETAVINAALSYGAGDTSYVLEKTDFQYEIKNQPEYITSVDNVDLSFLNKELTDYITSQKAFAEKNDTVFGFYYASKTRKVKILNMSECRANYISSVKSTKRDVFEKTKVFNQLSYIYTIRYTNLWEDECVLYVNVSALNIVKYPDGTVKWGSQSTDSMDFVNSFTEDSVEGCVNSTIMCNSDNYNISKIN